MAIDDRQIKAERYRYGYQGQYAEKDSLTNWNAFQLRMYEPRFGRWLSGDPKGQFNSPYIGMGNNPVSGVDPDGGFCCGESMIDLYEETMMESEYALNDMLRSSGNMLSAVTITPSIGDFIAHDLAIRGARLAAFGNDQLRGMNVALDNIGGFANGALNTLTYGLHALENPNRHLNPRAYALNQTGGAITAVVGSVLEGGYMNPGATPVLVTPSGTMPLLRPVVAQPSSMLDIHGNLNAEGSRISANSSKELKQLVNQLSQPGQKLTQTELDELRALVQKFGGKVRVDLDGVKGTGVNPHAHVEGLGSSVEARHIWLENGVY